MRIITIVCLSISLLGCTSFRSTAPTDYKIDDYFYIDSDWIKENQADLSERLVNTITEKHPNTASWFPLVQISNIDIAEDNASRWNSQALKREINSLLEITLNKIYPSAEPESSLQLNLQIRKASKEMNKVLYALQFPYGVACFGTLMLVCPIAGDQIVVVEGTFIKNDGSRLIFNGAGASTVVAISPYAGDDESWLAEANAKALIAALAQLTDNLVAHIDEQGI